MKQAENISTQILEARVKRGPGKIIAFIVAALVIVCAIGFAAYVNDYYHADTTAVQALEDSGSYADDYVTVENVSGKIAFVPDNPTAGFIFYPGGKVAAEAYAPLMQDLASKGVLCVICPMPFNLAVFDINAADGIMEEFPQITAGDWYIGGHSLGGSMAAQYVTDHLNSEGPYAHFAGIVLLGSYSTANLSEASGLRVLAIYGSSDNIINRDAYKKNITNLPVDAEEIVIDGGNHSQFGSYGQQAGDREATIPPATQWEITADTIVSWMRV